MRIQTDWLLDGLICRTMSDAATTKKEIERLELRLDTLKRNLADIEAALPELHAIRQMASEHDRELQSADECEESMLRVRETDDER